MMLIGGILIHKISKMKNKIIVVVGATGNLGGKIVNTLLIQGAEVRAIVRLETDKKK